MKRRLLLVMLIVALALVAVVPAFAHAAPPCNDSGDPGHSDYAQHHIRVLAQAGELGNEGHVPGTHQGYSLCNPSGN